MNKTPILSFLTFLALGLLLSISPAESKDKKEHFYDDGEPVPYYVNKIGPYANPSQTYPYYSFPFCPLPENEQKIVDRSAPMGDYLSGDSLKNSLYKFLFKVPTDQEPVCTLTLNKDQIAQFKKGIEELFYFQAYLDDLPVGGFVGTTDEEVLEDGTKKVHYYLFQHLRFHILYNGNHVIGVNVSSDLHQVKILDDSDSISVDFTYSVKWSPTDVIFEERHKLVNGPPQELEIHWLSIMNSFVLVILLAGFLAIIIMRVLKSDYSRYARAEEEEDDQEDYGWKLIHGDVFRFPPHKNLFCSFFGIGAQLLCLSFFLLILAVVGLFYPGSHGTIYTSAVVLYALTAGISGLVSSAFFKKLNGERWAWNVVATATLFGGPFFIVAAFVNTVATVYKVTAAIPVLTVIEVLLIWLGVGFPLTLAGSMAGKRLAGPFVAPCRTKNFPREIPPIPWYRSFPVQMVMAGFLPFSAIYIELFYIFTSVWGRNSYTLFGILFLVFIILLVVTSCITIALTYFQLSMEDHRWWWRSFASGGSTGIFIFVYSFFYYFYRSKMSGFLQGVFYFGYMSVICYFFFIMLGTVGFYSSLIFIRHIYSRLKID